MTARTYTAAEVAAAMPANRDDPPAEAVEAMARAQCQERAAFMGEPPCWRISTEWPNPHCDEPGCCAESVAAISALRALPAAARWRLIGWLAEGLEPTDGMAVAVSDGVAETGSYRHAVVAALTAAREASDAG